MKLSLKLPCFCVWVCVRVRGCAPRWYGSHAKFAFRVTPDLSARCFHRSSKSQWRWRLGTCVVRLAVFSGAKLCTGKLFCAALTCCERRRASKHELMAVNGDDIWSSPCVARRCVARNGAGRVEANATLVMPAKPVIVIVEEQVLCQLSFFCFCLFECTQLLRVSLKQAVSISGWGN